MSQDIWIDADSPNNFCSIFLNIVIFSITLFNLEIMQKNQSHPRIVHDCMVISGTKTRRCATNSTIVLMDNSIWLHVPMGLYSIQKLVFAHGQTRHKRLAVRLKVCVLKHSVVKRNSCNWSSYFDSYSACLQRSSIFHAPKWEKM